jgi:hypothetical protein
MSLVVFTPPLIVTCFVAAPTMQWLLSKACTVIATGESLAGRLGNSNAKAAPPAGGKDPV